jgi:pyruvate dehydrogenase E2 component (dihydrolipoamide acetyltransferase)
MTQSFTQKDMLFRRFQIHKYRAEGMVPTVTMTVTANITHMLELRRIANFQKIYSSHITITHLLTKAVADALKDYRLLFSFFTGKEIIENRELVISIPVDVEQHVEYIALHHPDGKNLSSIADETTEELNKIYAGNGTFFKVMKELMENSSGSTLDPLDFCRQHLGNFPISNFGSFHADNGSLAIAQPIIAGMCIGSAKPSALWQSGQWQECTLLPITISFDHRPVDGAYAGKFLDSVRKLLESPEQLFVNN